MEKLAIASYINPNQLNNQKSEILNVCRHKKAALVQTFLVRVDLMIWLDETMVDYFWLRRYSYIYIYIYIYIHPQTDSFVISQYISVARHEKCFKLGSKCRWLYASRLSYRRAISSLTVTEGILRICIIFPFFTYTLNGYRSAQVIR